MRKLKLSAYGDKIRSLKDTKVTHNLVEFLRENKFTPAMGTEILITSYEFYKNGWRDNDEWLQLLRKWKKELSCSIRVMGTIPTDERITNKIKELIDDNVFTMIKEPAESLNYHIFAMKDPAVVWVSEKHNGETAEISHYPIEPIQAFMEDAFKSYNTEWSFSSEIVTMRTCLEYYLTMFDKEVKIADMVETMEKMNTVLNEHGVSEKAWFVPDSVYGKRNEEVSRAIHDLWATRQLQLKEGKCCLTSEARDSIERWLSTEEKFAYKLLSDYCSAIVAA